MNTLPQASPPRREGQSIHSLFRRFAALLFALLIGTGSASAANILWVSDNPENADNSFTGPIPAAFDHAFVLMLQGAGHNIQRFNPPNSQNTLLTAAQLAAINTNDLIIIGRGTGSGAYQAPQSAQWNTNILKPLICMSPYLVRDNPMRMGWFNGNEGLDEIPSLLRGVDPTDLETDYLFAGVITTNDTTIQRYDEPLDRNTSVMVGPPVAGGKVLALAVGGVPTNGIVIAEFPTGTMVRGGADRLPAYRMFFAGGSRETGGSVTNAGKDNLTAMGESIFIRAVTLALNNGVAPLNPTAPPGILTQPANVTVVENSPATFSVVVTGAPPRTVQWQRAASETDPFIDISGATSVFQNSGVVLTNVTPADNGALFRVVVSGSSGLFTSDAARLTVITDVTPPTLVRAVGKWTMTNIVISFSEKVDPQGANFPFSYNGDNGLSIESATLDATGTNVFLTTSVQTPGTVYTITVTDIQDRAAAPNTIAANSTISFTAWVPSRGFLVSEIFTGISGNAISELLNHPSYPHSPTVWGYVNISSNAPTPRETYGGRLVGWIIPPVSGDYIFYIRGDDGTDLRLSPSEDPAARVSIAAQTAANQPYTSGASAPQTLVAGQRYAVEALWKEGTGGDYMQFAWQIPGSSAITSIPTGSLETYADPVGVSVAITQHPQGGSAVQNRTITFTTAATLAPASLASLASYQWQKSDGAGGFTNAIGANSPSFTTALLQFPEDNASQWRVIVAIPGGSATSDVATVTVTQDLTPPTVLSVGSLDGRTIGICFDELMENTPGLNSVNDSFSYEVNGVNPLSVTVRPDERSVILNLENPVGSTYTVMIGEVRDRALNTMAPVTLNGTNFGLAGLDVGVPGQRGSHFVCDSTNIEMVGGGADMWNTADTNYYAYRSITGDFDARVRVTALAGQDAITKAGLMMRETTNSNSRVIHLNVNPANGRNQLELAQRPTAGAASVSWAASATPLAANVPNAWMRLVRSGNTWTGYFSSNGTDWTQTGQTNLTYPATVLIGLGLTAHNNSLLATGTFSNFTITQPAADIGITKLGAPIVSQGSSFLYTISVTNRGPDTATGVTVTDALPAGLTFISAASSQGACTQASGTVTCNIGTLASAGSATVNIIVSAVTSGTKNNTATVGSNAQESNAANNSATLTTRVLPLPVMSNISFVGGTFSGSVATETGIQYVVQYKDSFNDTEWKNLTILDGDGTTKSFSDNTGGPQRFYRTVAQLP